MTAPVLSLRHIEKTFPSGDGLVRVLADVSLDLAPREFSALMGPSGSGKSTLLLVAGMLEPPTAGSVFLDGEPLRLTDLSPAGLRDIRLSRVGFVFQKPNLIPFLTASENVEIVLAIAGLAKAERRRRAAAMLAELDLAHRTGQYPSRLSGGEQQRVAIARALVNRPRLVLADEPTAALDGKRGRQALELLRALARERGSAVLVVTHDERCLDLFDRVMRIEDGRLSPASLPTGGAMPLREAC